MKVKKPLPYEVICPKCDQKTRVNLERDPKIEWGNIIQCPNCGERFEVYYMTCHFNAEKFEIIEEK